MNLTDSEIDLISILEEEIKQIELSRDKLIRNKTKQLNKAKNEKKSIDKFICLLNNPDLCFKSFLKTPLPDFLIKSTLANTNIGVELTSLNIEKEKKKYDLIIKTLKNARVAFIEKNPDFNYNILVSFSSREVFGKNFDYLLNIKDEILNDLISIVQFLNDNNEMIDYHVFHNVFDFPDSKFIDRLSFTKGKVNSNEWTLSSGLSVPEINKILDSDNKQTLIDKLINSKNVKVANYGDLLDEAWLLIYAQENNQATMFTLDRFDYDKCYKTTYDKVYLMLEDKLVLLNTIK